MFRHQICHPQGAWFVTLLNYEGRAESHEQQFFVK